MEAALVVDSLLRVMMVKDSLLTLHTARSAVVPETVYVAQTVPWASTPFGIIVLGVIYTVIATVVAFLLLKRWQRQPPSAEEIARAAIRLEREAADEREAAADRAWTTIQAIYNLTSEHKRAVLAGELLAPGFERDVLRAASDARSQTTKVRDALRSDNLADQLGRLCAQVEMTYRTLPAVIDELRARHERRDIPDDGSLRNLLVQRMGNLNGIPAVAENVRNQVNAFRLRQHQVPAQR